MSLRVYKNRYQNYRGWILYFNDFALLSVGKMPGSAAPADLKIGDWRVNFLRKKRSR